MIDVAPLNVMDESPAAWWETGVSPAPPTPLPHLSGKSFLCWRCTPGVHQQTHKESFSLSPINNVQLGGRRGPKGEPFKSWAVFVVIQKWLFGAIFSGSTLSVVDVLFFFLIEEGTATVLFRSPLEPLLFSSWSPAAGEYVKREIRGATCLLIYHPCQTFVQTENKRERCLLWEEGGRRQPGAHHVTFWKLIFFLYKHIFS